MTEEYTFVTRPVIVRGNRCNRRILRKRLDELLSG